MLELSPPGRAGAHDGAATVGALRMASDGGFMTGADSVMNGSVTAASLYGEIAPNRADAFGSAHDAASGYAEPRSST